MSYTQRPMTTQEIQEHQKKIDNQQKVIRSLNTVAEMEKIADMEFEAHVSFETNLEIIKRFMEEEPPIAPCVSDPGYEWQDCGDDCARIDILPTHPHASLACDWNGEINQEAMCEFLKRTMEMCPEGVERGRAILHELELETVDYIMGGEGFPK